MKNTMKKIVVLILILVFVLLPTQHGLAATVSSKTLLDKYGEYLVANYIITSQNADSYFMFYDLDGNGQKEMIVNCNFSSGVYSYENGIVQLVDLGGEGKSALYYNARKKIYYFIDTSGPFFSQYSITIKNHVATRRNELRDTIITDYEDEYTYNGKKITVYKYDELLDKYYGGDYDDKFANGYKLTVANIKKYCGYTEGENSSLSKAKNLDLKLEYVEADYAYNEIFTWDSVSGADGYELYRKQIDVRLDPVSNFAPSWLAREWTPLSDTKTNQFMRSKFRPGDKLNWYVVRPYKLVKGKKVYGPFSEIISVDEMGMNRA